jgi:hypothetical protein
VHFFLAAGGAHGVLRCPHAAQRRKFGKWVAFGLILTIFSAIFSHRSTSSSSRPRHTLTRWHIPSCRHTQSRTQSHGRHAPRTRASHTTRRHSAGDVATCIRQPRESATLRRARARTATAARSVHRSPTLITDRPPSPGHQPQHQSGTCSRPQRVVPASPRAATRARAQHACKLLRDCHAIIAAEAHMAHDAWSVIP